MKKTTEKIPIGEQRRLKRLSKPKKKNIHSLKAKGRSLQKWVAARIAEATGYECGRDKPIESRPMGQIGVDVRLESEVMKLFPFSVECKNQEYWNIPEWIRDAKENQIIGTNWLLIIKKNRHEPVAIMDASEFFRLYKNFLDVMAIIGKIRKPPIQYPKKTSEEDP